MSTVDETKHEEETTPAAAHTDAASPAPVAEAASDDPLDGLLAEYDRAVSPVGDSSDLDELLGVVEDSQQQAEARQREQAFQAEREQAATQLAQAAMQITGIEQENGELKGTVQQLQQAIQAEQWRQHVARNKEDFSRLASAEAARLGDPNLGARDIENHLLGEATRDPELVRAWDAQYYNPPGPLERAQLERAIISHGQQLAKAAMQITDPIARALAEKHIAAELQQIFAQTFPDPNAHRANAKAYVRKVIGKMREDLGRRPPRIDEDATADRMAVVQAVRGASSKVSVEPTPDFGSMSDWEFRKYSKHNLGFEAI
jgi:hypothetical protein